MAAPTITGTPAGTAQTTAASIDVTMTVPADATAIFVGFGGFGSNTSVTSVQGDPTGTPYNFDDVTLFVQRSSAQLAGLYGIYDTNGNWPGSGSITVRVTLAAASKQLKAGIFCVAGVDTAGTPANGTNTGSGAAGTPSLSVTSSSNALNIGVAGTYSADIGGGDDTLIYEEQNSTSASSLYIWHEAGTSASDTVEGNASVDWAMVTISLEGTGGGGGGSSNGPMSGPLKGPLGGFV